MRRGRLKRFSSLSKRQYENYFILYEKLRVKVSEYYLFSKDHSLIKVLTPS